MDLDRTGLTPDERDVWKHAFAWSSAWGHEADHARSNADRAVLRYRESPLPPAAPVPFFLTPKTPE